VNFDSIHVELELASHLSDRPNGISQQPDCSFLFLLILLLLLLLRWTLHLRAFLSIRFFSLVLGWEFNLSLGKGGRKGYRHTTTTTTIFLATLSAAWKQRSIVPFVSSLAGVPPPVTLLAAESSHFLDLHFLSYIYLSQEYQHRLRKKPGPSYLLIAILVARHGCQSVRFMAEMLHVFSQDATELDRLRSLLLSSLEWSGYNRP
jgi:hypothetical protein